jgi:hypothetical protein
MKCSKLNCRKLQNLNVKKGVNLFAEIVPTFQGNTTSFIATYQQRVTKIIFEFERISLDLVVVEA